MGLLEGQIILGRGWVFGPRGKSHSARVIKANTRLLNYSERWAAQCLCHQLNVTHSRRHHSAHTPTWLICHIGCVRPGRRCLSIVLMLQRAERPAVPREEPYCLQSYCIYHLHVHITGLSTPSYTVAAGPCSGSFTVHKCYIHNSPSVF